MQHLLSRSIPFKIAASICFIFLLTNCTKEAEFDAIESFVFNIEVPDIVPIHEKVSMEFCIYPVTESGCLAGSIERRGGFSISFPKHSYELDFDEDVSIAGLDEDDDWILNANYIDKTFLRHVISYELFQDMNSNNLVSNTEFVEMSLNQEYQGLYVLMEKLDKSSLDIDANDSTSFIFKEPHLFRESYENVVPQDASNFHQQTFPKIEDNNKEHIIEELRNFITTSADIEFENEIGRLVDIQNIIDWHLLLLLTNNNDGVLKNFFLYKQNIDSPIRVAPWDYDHSFGRDGDNELNLNERFVQPERSILLKRLLTTNWYRILLKDRWLELNQLNIFSTDALKLKVTNKSKLIRSMVVENQKMWPVDSEWYHDSNDFDDEIAIMLQFIDARHKGLVEYFEQI